MTGFFTCHCSNTGVERTPNKSQHAKLTLEKKFLPPLLPEFELATFRSRVRRSTKNNKLSRLPVQKDVLHKMSVENFEFYFCQTLSDVLSLRLNVPQLRASIRENSVFAERVG